MKSDFFCFKKIYLYFFIFIFIIFLNIKITYNKFPLIMESKATEKNIIGGTCASFGDYPYFVGLALNRPNKLPFQNYFCGGTLISPYYVITAKHCINGIFAQVNGWIKEDIKKGVGPTPTPMTLNGIVAYANFTDLSQMTRAYQSTIESKESLGFYDLSLLKLKYPINIAKYPSLPEDYSYYNLQQEFTLLGFGESKLNNNSSLIYPSNCLNMAKQKIIGEAPGIFTGKSTDNSLCKKDSGGPAIVRELNRDILIGVSTDKIGPCEPNVNNIYAKTRQSYIFSNTIDKIMKTIK